MNRLSVLVAGIMGSLILPSYTALTQVEASEYSHPWYLGAGFGVSRLEPRPRQPQILNVGDNADTGVHLYLGYDINRWLSAEVLLAVPGEARLDRIDAGREQIDIDRIDYAIADISALFYLFNNHQRAYAGSVDNSSFAESACRQGLSLYGRVGLGYMRNTDLRDSVEHDKNFSQHIGLGAGVEYAFSNTIGMRAEYTAFDSDARYLGFSLLKRLGVSSCQHKPIKKPVPVAVLPQGTTKELVPPVKEPEPPVVYFDFDIDEPDGVNMENLVDFAESIQMEDRHLLLQGHTDSLGSNAYNEELSKRRVLSVFQFMKSQGIPESSISVQYHGELQPVSDNQSDAGRADNRRVTLQFTD